MRLLSQGVSGGVLHLSAETTTDSNGPLESCHVSNRNKNDTQQHIMRLSLSFKKMGESLLSSHGILTCILLNPVGRHLSPSPHHSPAALHSRTEICQDLHTSTVSKAGMRDTPPPYSS